MKEKPCHVKLTQETHFMNTRHKFHFVLCLLTLFGATSHAEEIHVFAAGASKVAIELAAPAFTRMSGDTLVVTSDTVGALRDRISQGQRPDLTILSQAAIASVVTQGHVQTHQTLQVGVVSAGLAVKRGAPVPNISTVDGLKAALLQAKSVAHADGTRGATSGAHFAKVIDQLSLRESLQSKLVILPFGVEVIEGVADGKFELGASQSSEIVPHQAVTYIGDLPAPFALRTPYMAGVVNKSEKGARLLKFLAAPDGLDTFTASGFGR
jgi:molybdate transport system substrate-binding protein